MYRILEILRKEDSFLSGEEIGRRLEISRAAVWKGMKKLRDGGYEIEAVTNRGYRLILKESLYNEKEIVEGLETKVLGRPLFFYDEVDSTSTVIRHLALEGAPEGALAVAERQTGARGRRGRAWQSPGGSGIWMSLLLRPTVHPTKASVLTLLMGMAVNRAIREETGLETQIKWPNDILLNDKKLVGILTEMECEMNSISSVTMGVGINVNIHTFPEDLASLATSLYREGGRAYSRKKILQKVLLLFEQYYQQFLEEKGDFTPFVKEYTESCQTIGREIKVLGAETFFATALGVTEEGALRVRRADNGKEEVVFSGEVSIRGR